MYVPKLARDWVAQGREDALVGHNHAVRWPPSENRELSRPFPPPVRRRERLRLCCVGVFGTGAVVGGPFVGFLSFVFY